MSARRTFPVLVALLMLGSQLPQVPRLGLLHSARAGTAAAGVLHLSDGRRGRGRQAGPLSDLPNGSGAGAARPRVVVSESCRRHHDQARCLPDRQARARPGDRLEVLDVRRRRQLAPAGAGQLRERPAAQARTGVARPRRSQPALRRPVLHGRGQVASSRRHLSARGPVPDVLLRQLHQADFAEGVHRPAGDARREQPRDRFGAAERVARRPHARGQRPQPASHQQGSAAPCRGEARVQEGRTRAAVRLHVRGALGRATHGARRPRRRLRPHDRRAAAPTTTGAKPAPTAGTRQHRLRLRRLRIGSALRRRPRRRRLAPVRRCRA